MANPKRGPQAAATACEAAAPDGKGRDAGEGREKAISHESTQITLGPER